MEYGTCRHGSGNDSSVAIRRNGLSVAVLVLLVFALIVCCYPGYSLADDTNGANLRSAVANAAPGATITLAAGAYTLDTPIAISVPLTIQGAGNTQTFIQSGVSSLFRISYFATGTVTLRGLTLRNGINGNPASESYHFHGGAILSEPGDGNTNLVIDGCTVSDSTTANGDGGGIAVRSGKLTIINSTIRNNTAANGVGGGIFAGAGAIVSISGSTIDGNHAGGIIGNGGGICLLGPAGGMTSSISNSSIINNTSAYDGAGIYTTAPLDITNVSYGGNLASRYANDLWNDSGAFSANDVAPVVTLAASGVYTEGTGAKALDPSLIISDSDSMYLSSATVTLDITPDGTAENLAVDVSGTAIVAEVVRQSGRIIVNLSQPDRLDNYQSVLRKISYINTSVTPSTTIRNISFKVKDGSLDSFTKTLALSVNTVNNPPTVTFTQPSYAVVEQTNLNLQATGISIADVDAGSGGVSATLSVTQGILNVSAGTSGASVSNSGSSSVTIDGTLAQINALLAGSGGAAVVYYNGNDAPADNVTLTLAVNDNGNSGGPAENGSAGRTITVSAVNDQPLLTVNSGLTLYQNDGQTVISSGRLQILDPDNPAPSTLVYTLTAVPAKGALKKGATELIVGNTFTQADLDGGIISFAPEGTTNGADSFAFTYTDGIAAALGPVSFAVTITPAYTLTVTRAGSGAGSITATGCTLNWSGGAGSCTVLTDTPIILSASAEPGSVFAGWSAGTGSTSTCSGDGDCSFTLSQVSSLTGTILPLRTVTPSAGANGSISPNTPRAVAENSSAFFTIKPNPGYHVMIPIGGTCGGTYLGDPHDPANGIIYATNAVIADCTVSASFSFVPDVTISSAASINGAWSGNSPDVWTPNGALANVSITEIEARLNAGTAVVIDTGMGVAGDIHVNVPLSWSANTLSLIAAGDIHVNAIMTASGQSTLVMNTTAGSIKTGLSSLGFHGRIDFPGRSGAGFLAINGEDFTVINSLGSPGSITPTDLQGINGAPDGRYALGANIMAADTASWDSGAGFIPLGTDVPFSGVFDGLGHTVSALTVNRGINNVGLFAVTGVTAKVRNTGLSGASISGGNYVGGLVGNNAGSIDTSFSGASVSGFDFVGGLAGQNDGQISHSFTSGSVSGSHYYAGGLVGWNHANIIGNCFSAAEVNGGWYVGGLVGENYVFNTLSSSISNSYSSGSVTGADLVGGLTGVNYGLLDNAYSSGAVTGSGNSVGGLVGWINGDYGGSINNAFWDNTVNSTLIDNGAGTGKSTVEMMTQATYGAWDISTADNAATVWRIFEGQSYPLLRAFFAPQTITGFLPPLTATYGDGPITLTATASSGLPVNFSVISGPGSINGNILTITGAGTIQLMASQAGNATYSAAPSLTAGIVVAKAAAVVTLGSLSQTYNGNPRYATATTDPSGKSVSFTYNNSPVAPVNAGSYAVTATIDDADYQGSASGTLVIAKATATVILGNLSHIWDGTAKAATATTNPAGKSVFFTYNSSPTPPSNVGSYTVVGAISDANYQGSASGTLVINDLTRPVVNTFSAVPRTNFLIADITIFASDNALVTGYCVTESDTGSGCGWTPSVPGSYTFATAGAKTLYAFARDAAGNISDPYGATLTVSIPTLTVIVGGTGTGSVTSSPAGISCSGGSCSNTFSGTVNLYATPSVLSNFSGWGGACSGASTACSVLMNGEKTVTANFIPAALLRIDGTIYKTLQEVYDAAYDGAVIQLLDNAVAGTLDANRNIGVKLKGGYDAGYTDSSGTTTVTGPLTVSQGGLLVDRIVIR
ncbi:MAG: MBG domain-containing protein [Geobacteraceae bacterium]|nr:MBG domain-containing protein [Geobacteraceae bacterium]